MSNSPPRTLRDMSERECADEIQECDVILSSLPGKTSPQYVQLRARRDQLWTYMHEIRRRNRHTTPHNKTRLGDLWPVT